MTTDFHHATRHASAPMHARRRTCVAMRQPCVGMRQQAVSFFPADARMWGATAWHRTCGGMRCQCGGMRIHAGIFFRVTARQDVARHDTLAAFATAGEPRPVREGHVLRSHPRRPTLTRTAPPGALSASAGITRKSDDQAVSMDRDCARNWHFNRTNSCW
jgi:hypothetical protein